MSSKVSGVLALYDNPDDFVSAVKKVKGRLSVKKIEAYSPFPVHGMEHAMRLKRSWIPYLTLIMAVSGWCLGFYFQAWTSSVSWPLNIGGKPFISWPAFIPVAFECMILFGGVSTVLILYVVCGLPQYTKPVLDVRLTNDKFGLFVDSSDVNFDEGRLNEILKETNVTEIKKI